MKDRLLRDIRDLSLAFDSNETKPELANNGRYIFPVRNVQDWLVSREAMYVQNGAVGAGAGLYALSLLYNPMNSKNDVVLDRVYISTATAGNMLAGVVVSPFVTGFIGIAGQPQNGYQNGLSEALVDGFTDTAPHSGVGQYAVLANTILMLEPKCIIRPGMGYAICQSVVNTTINATFHWREFAIDFGSETNR